MSSHRSRGDAARFAHPGAARGNFANHIFHKNHALQLAAALGQHITCAERDRPGCTGDASDHLTALMLELQRSSRSLEFKRDDVRGDETKQET